MKLLKDKQNDLILNGSDMSQWRTEKRDDHVKTRRNKYLYPKKEMVYKSRPVYNRLFAMVDANYLASDNAFTPPKYEKNPEAFDGEQVKAFYQFLTNGARMFGQGLGAVPIQHDGHLDYAWEKCVQNDHLGLKSFRSTKKVGYP